MITKDQYDIIDDKSRPGYIKIKLKKSGAEIWARIWERNPEAEYSVISPEQRKALGLMPGMRGKSWNEMTKAEQKLFSEDNSVNPDTWNEEN